MHIIMELNEPCSLLKKLDNLMTGDNVEKIMYKCVYKNVYGNLRHGKRRVVPWRATRVHTVSVTSRVELGNPCTVPLYGS